MTDNHHPITPPPELVQQWWDGTHGALYEFEAVATQAARWGADQELEACCSWANTTGWYGAGDMLRAARRPKPPSLRERALKILEEEPEADDMKELIVFDTAQVEIIRRALESLPE